MIVAGIDEAGYGPLLGPLVVTGAAFEVPDDTADACLWDVLSRSITRSPSRRDNRLPVADSKKLYQRKAGLSVLERTALVMLRVADRNPGTARGLLDVLCPGATEALSSYPWYGGFDLAIPVSTTTADVKTRANAVSRDMTEAGVRFSGVFSELLAEGEFNRKVEQTHNKAVVLAEATFRVMHRILGHASGRRVRIRADRHGGRRHYVDALMRFFDGCRLRVLEESDDRSAYELDYAGWNWTVEFLTRAEDHHLPVALASVYCKYVRELMMHRLNAYFAERVEGLRPTAGYYTDAIRFLADVESAVLAEKIDRSMLVRSR